MILVVNLNLTVDRTMQIPELLPGNVVRATRTDLQAGGKGVNVARVLRALGEQYLVLGFVAGRTGEYIDARLGGEGINRSLVTMPGESRTSVILVESGIGRQTVINEYGPEVPPDSLDQFLNLFADRIASASFIILTGSIPPGAGEDIYSRLIELANRAGKRALLDAAGEQLKHGVSAGPTIVKPNQYEAAALCNCRIDSTEKALASCRQIISDQAGNHPEIAAITLGKAGMVIASASEAYLLKPPVVDAHNAVGAGDSTAAGLAAGMIRGLGLPEAARLGVACGAASAMHGFGRVSIEEVERLQKQVEVTRLD